MAEKGEGRIISVASGKGGTGKTILVSNLGTALTLLGRKVVVVDVDLAMADLGLYLGLEKSPITLHEVLAGEASIEQALYEGPAGCMVVPSGLSLSGFARANPQRLAQVTKDLAARFEFVILDCAPDLSKESATPLTVADEVILVVNPDLASLADALRVKMMCEAVDTPLRGVVVNRTGLTRAELAPREVGSMLGMEILSVIPEDEEVRKSANLKVPVVMKKKDSPAAAAQIALARKLAGKRHEEADSAVLGEKGKPSKLRSIFGR